MPELPEVETIRRGLARLAPSGSRIARVETRRKDLRFPLPRGLARRLEDRTITGYRRHGKYLLWDTSGGPTLLSHLGMSGSWRHCPDEDERVHDHLYLHLGDGRRLAYHDPRRFGYVDLVKPGAEASHPRLGHLGPDALDEAEFDGAYLRRQLAGRKAAIKSLLLDQRLVAGVGNIYAVEALFRARIRPRRAGGRISGPRLDRLAAAVRAVLLEAIESGGSTLRDYVSADGEMGYFQHRFAVYGRDGEPCPQCATTLQGAVLGGRATVWCKRCQA